MSVLSCKIESLNDANKEANKLCLEFAEILKPFVGKKVVKLGGYLASNVNGKIQEVLEKYHGYDTGISVNHSLDHTMIRFIVKAYHLFDEMRIYKYVDLKVGVIKDGILVKLCEYQNLRTDHNENEVLELRKKYAELKEKMDTIQSQLKQFDVRD